MKKQIIPNTFILLMHFDVINFSKHLNMLWTDFEYKICNIQITSPALLLKYLGKDQTKRQNILMSNSPATYAEKDLSETWQKHQGRERYR